MAKKEPQEMGADSVTVLTSRGVTAVPLALALAVGLAVGGAAGAFVAGPLLAKRVIEDIEHVAAQAGERHVTRLAAEASAPRSGVQSERSLAAYTIENLVLNPAGTGGSRYLLLSVSFGVADSTVAGTLKQRENEVRDIVLGVLGKRGVAQLADQTLREELKKEVGAAVDSLFGAPTVEQVLFPQYVLQ